MNNNPMKALVKMYNAQVKKNNKRGYAKVLKRCAELFFRDINQESIWPEERFHFADIEFLSGYFIFGYGQTLSSISMLRNVPDDCLRFGGIFPMTNRQM